MPSTHFERRQVLDQSQVLDRLQLLRASVALEPPKALHRLGLQPKPLQPLESLEVPHTTRTLSTDRPTKYYCNDSNSDSPYSTDNDALINSVPDSIPSPEALQLLANQLATGTQTNPTVPATLAATAQFLANLPDGCLQFED